MRIALTGISGFIGSVIARRLHEAGHVVTGLVRASSQRDHIKPYMSRFVVGEQSDQTTWPALLEGADCVIHNSVAWEPLRAPVDLPAHLRTNLAGSIELLHASAPRQFIFMSTIAVHHDMRPRWGGVIDEDHPLRPGGLYGAYKAAVEAHLWAEHAASGRNTSALRPCAVYGIDPDLERSHGYRIIKALRSGEPIGRPGGGKYVHVDDVAAAAVAAVGNPAVAGRPFNLADCYARHADWAALAAGLLGIDAPIDFTSPPQPKNTFTKDAARSLGVPLDRGHEGIRQHLRDLIAVMG
jgi:nucleoside-diphosphate-sugar epimerase